MDVFRRRAQLCAGAKTPRMLVLFAAKAAPADSLATQSTLRKYFLTWPFSRIFFVVKSVQIKKRLLTEPLYHHKYMFLGLKSPANSYLKVSSKLVSNPVVILLLLTGDSFKLRKFAASSLIVN